MTLWHHAIKWGNPYTDPPSGMPRIIAEMATYSTDAPADLVKIHKEHWIGTGYIVTVAPINEPPRTISQGARAKIRKQKMESRIKASYPMFAEQLIVQELDERSEYFNGENDPGREADRMTVISEMRDALEFYGRRVGKLIAHVDFNTKQEE